jgi:regulator of sigma E protease
LELLALMPSFGGLVWTLLAFVAALSVVVAVHEYGHYIVARWSGIHSEVFSIGFGPRLLTWTDRNGTRWQVAALPLGGYVRFAGDADARSTPDSAALSRLSRAERRRTLAGAPLWARAATVAAGPAFNFVLSLVVFSALALFRGVATDEPVIGAIDPLPIEQTIAPGDRVLAIEGVAVESFEDIFTAAPDLPERRALAYRVERDGQIVEAVGPHPLPAVAAMVQPQTAAHDVGMESGDVILAVDGEEIASFEALRQRVIASEGRALLLDIWREGERLEIALAPRRADLPRPEGGFETRWLIGLSGALGFEPQTRMPGPLEALAIGAGQTWDIAATSLSGLWHMIAGQISSCNLRGPVGIAETSAAAAAEGLSTFIWFIAMLSTAVGLMNLFPIPVLDGGHLVFHAYEALTGRQPGERAMRWLIYIGLSLLGGLMVFALANDFLCP